MYGTIRTPVDEAKKCLLQLSGGQKVTEPPAEAEGAKASALEAGAGAPEAGAGAQAMPQPEGTNTADPNKKGSREAKKEDEGSTSQRATSQTLPKRGAKPKKQLDPSSTLQDDQQQS